MSTHQRCDRCSSEHGPFYALHVTATPLEGDGLAVSEGYDECCKACVEQCFAALHRHTRRTGRSHQAVTPAPRRLMGDA